MNSTDALAIEFSLDLTAQELETLPAAAPAEVEIEDIGELEPLVRPQTPAANAERAGIEDTGGTVEIELTAEQVLALLTGEQRPVTRRDE